MAFVPFGSKDEIKLSVEIIKNLVCNRTKSGATCDDRQALRFMMLCQAQRLNPFAGDAFLIGYDSKDGPQFSLVTAHQAFLKRAEVSPGFDGMESGIIVQDVDDQIKEIQGDFRLSDQVLLGGWAKVFHKERSHPTYRRLKVERFKKSFGVWQDDPEGMICKCAEADALRSTFPTLLGGLYMQDEMPQSAIDISDQPRNRLVETTSAPTETTVVVEKETAKEITPSVELCEIVLKAGFTFDQFRAWAVGSGNLDEKIITDGFEDISSELAKRLLRNKSGLLAGLKGAQ